MNKHYYKIDPEYNSRVGNNMLYTPYIDGEKMCMHYDSKSEYQKYTQRPDFTDTLLTFFFHREVENLKVFKNYKWAPQVYDVNIDSKKILIEFPGETLNDIFYTEGRDIDKELPDWKEQLSDIIKDIHDRGYYKMSLYPHCFFISKEGVLKTIDFYACVSHEERYLPITTLNGMMGTDSQGRFKEAMVGSNVDFDYFFKRILTTHVKWPQDIFPQIYERIYG